jgi:hypothetical protein
MTELARLDTSRSLVGDREFDNEVGQPTRAAKD